MAQSPPEEGNLDSTYEGEPVDESQESQRETASGVPTQDPTPSLENAIAPESEEAACTAVVRYGLMRHLGRFRHERQENLTIGTKVVVRTPRGVELGEIVATVGEKTCFGCLNSQHLEQFLSASGSDYSLKIEGKVLRPANPQDIIDHRHLENSARDEAVFCRQQIQQLGLEMKLVTVDHLLGGERIIFYFSAESRVDFRELVHRLAGQYRTRIEMRQVGARDEARLVADYERCGLQCCCQRFIKNLKPVSMRMAKTQKATLDPSKISGRCGRLMCCLRFEDATYDELRKKLPKKNTYVQTDRLVGRVLDTQILTQLVRLALPDGSQTVIANEDILQYDVSPSETPPLPGPTAEAPSAKPSSGPESPAEAAASAPPRETSATDEQPTGKKKRRRRRRPSRNDATPAPAAKEMRETPSVSEPPAEASASADTAKEHQQAPPTKRKRRRRRRRKKKQ